MNIDAINTFLLLSETGNFSRVAQKSNLTQSTISARIKVLEDSLGVRLFERTPSGVFLTEAGKKFYGYAATMRQTWQQGRQALARSVGEYETLGVGIHMTMWRRFMPEWLVWIRDKHPEISVHVEADYSERLVEYVSQGVLDIAITHMPTGQAGLDIELFSDDELVMVSSIERDFKSCHPKDYVYIDWSYGFREEHQEKMPGYEISMTNIGYWEIALDYLRASDCYTYVPQQHVAAEIENGELYIVSGAPVLSRPSYLVVAKQTALNGLVQTAIEGLREAALRYNSARKE